MKIAWAYDMSDNIFSRSGIVDLDSEYTKKMMNDPDNWEFSGSTELTREGADLLDKYVSDAALGYNLGTGRATGLAQKYTQWEIYQTLCESPEYNKSLTPEKFKITGQEEHTVRGLPRTLYRIEAARNIVDGQGNVIVAKGTVGGLIDNPDSLSHRGACWVGDNAKVLDDGYVKEDAQMRGNSVLGISSELSGRAQMHDNAYLGIASKATDDVIIKGNAEVYDECRLINDVIAGGDVQIYTAELYEGEYTEGVITEQPEQRSAGLGR